MRAVATELRGHADRVRTAERHVVIRDSRLVIPEVVVDAIVDDSANPTVALAVRATSGDLRVRHHRVHSAGSTAHDVSTPDHRAVGVLVISPDDRLEAAAALEAMADAAERHGWDDEPVALATVALVRSGIPVSARLVPDLPWGIADDADSRDRLMTAVESIDPQRISALLANRPDDGLYSTFVLRRLSKPVTAFAIRHGIRPNAITLASLVIGLAAAGAFAIGNRPMLVIGALLLQLSLVIDCSDGEVARATRAYSPVGAWLDASTDRVKEFAAYAGLAAGAAAATGANLWPLALILLVVQTFRHMGDYDFSRVQRQIEGVIPARSLDERSDGGTGEPAWAAQSQRINQRRIVMWTKKAAHMPIGERWLVLSVGAAIGGAAVALWALLVLTLIALAYVTAARILRTRSFASRPSESSVALIERQLDLAVLTRWALPPVASRSGWFVPALLRLAELGTVALLSIVVAPSAVVVAFWWCFVVAFHHYDALYRALQGQEMPRWIVLTGLGCEGRTLVVLVASAVGIMVGVMTAGTVALAVLFVVVASAQFLSTLTRGRDA